MFEEYNSCTLCPRNCKVDRTNNQKGYCGCTAELSVARADLHFWEEPCISGNYGSGTVFFTGCSLKCDYCQNYSISRNEITFPISTNRLSEIFIELQDKNAHNINLVTGTQYVPHIIKSAKIARDKGLHIPIIYNCSGYESLKTIKMLEGTVDIYLPDFKYLSPIPAKKYSNASDYFKHAAPAVKEMVRQQPVPVFDENGIMKNGVIIRHMILPGFENDSKQIIEYLYQSFGDSVFLSIMNQFTPMQSCKHPELQNKVSKRIYDDIVDYAVSLGVENGFVQEDDTADESFIPSFNGEGVI